MADWIEIKDESSVGFEHKMFNVDHKDYGYRLGVIKWSGIHKQYVFYSFEATLDREGLDHISNFLNEINQN